MIELRCPACQQTIKLDDSFTGKRVACIGCAKEFNVPDSPQPARGATAPQSPSFPSPPRSAETSQRLPSMPAAVSSNRQQPLLEKVRQHRHLIMSGVVVVGLGLAALVMYNAFQDGRGDDDDNSLTARTASPGATGGLPDSAGSSPTTVGSSARADRPPVASVRRENELTTTPPRTVNSSGTTTPPTRSKPAGGKTPAGTGKQPRTDQPADEPIVTSARYSATRYTATAGLLLKDSSELNDWLAVPYDSAIEAGTRIAVPRPFDATLEVGRKMYRVCITGGTSAQVLESPDAGPVGFELRRGRLIIEGQRSGDVPGAVLSLAVKGERWRIELLAGNTVFGVEILPRIAEQFEQDFGGVTYTGGIFVVKGSIRLSDAAGKTRQVAGNSWLSLALDDRLDSGTGAEDLPGKRLPEPQFRPLPDWLDFDTNTAEPKVNREADLFEKSYNRQQAFDTAIQPILASSNAKLVELGVHCLALLEKRSLLVPILNESKSPNVRLAAVTGMRWQMPAAAEGRQRFKDQLRQTFGSETAQAVYSLLWGYRADEVRKNQFTCFQLVSWLTHAHIAVRELAWQQMKRHATAVYGYRPDARATVRRKAAKLWQRHVLKKGTILGDELR
jgi:hypothetical protein